MTLDILKSKFSTGSKPTGADFAELIDTLGDKSTVELVQENVEIVHENQTLLNEKILILETSVLEVKEKLSQLNNEETAEADSVIENIVADITTIRNNIETMESYSAVEMQSEIDAISNSFDELRALVEANVSFDSTIIEAELNTAKEEINTLKADVEAMKNAETTPYDDTLLVEAIESLESELNLLKEAQQNPTQGQGVDHSEQILAIELEIENIKTSILNLENKENAVYDDSELVGRVVTLEESKLSLEQSIATISDNIATLASYDDTEIAGRVSTLEENLEMIRTAVGSIIAYDDTILRSDVELLKTEVQGIKDSIQSIGDNTGSNTESDGKITVLEEKIATLESDVEDIEVLLKAPSYDDTQIRGLVNTLQTEVTSLKTIVNESEVYDDTEVRGKITALETDVATLKTQTPTSGETYDDTEITGRVVAVETTVQGIVEKNYDASLLDVGRKVNALETSSLEEKAKVVALENTVSEEQTKVVSLIADVETLKMTGGSGGGEVTVDLTEVNKNIAETKNRVTTLESDNLSNKSDISVLKSQKDTLAEDVQGLKDSKDATDSALEVVEVSIDSLESQIGNIGENIADIETNVLEIDERVEVLEGDNTLNKSEIAKVKTDIASVNTNLSASNTSLTKALTDLQSVQTEVETLAKSSTVETIDTKVVALETDNVANKGKIATLETDVTNLETDVATMEIAIDTVELDMATAKVDIQALDDEVETLKSEDAEIKESIETVKGDVNTVKDKITAIETANTSINTALSSVDAKVVTLETEVATIKESAIDESRVEEIEGKLDTVEEGANKYIHPTGDGNLHVPATSTTNNGKFLKAGTTEGSMSWSTIDKTTVGLGNVDNTSDANKPISIATQTALDTKADNSVATDSKNGLMSSDDKTKLDTVEEGANHYELPTATTSVLGGVMLEDTLESTSTSKVLTAKQGNVLSKRINAHMGDNTHLNVEQSEFFEKLIQLNNNAYLTNIAVAMYNSTTRTVDATKDNFGVVKLSDDFAIGTGGSLTIDTDTLVQKISSLLPSGGDGATAEPQVVEVETIPLPSEYDARGYGVYLESYTVMGLNNTLKDETITPTMFGRSALIVTIVSETNGNNPSVTQFVFGISSKNKQRLNKNATTWKEFTEIGGFVANELRANTLNINWTPNDYKARGTGIVSETTSASRIGLDGTVFGSYVNVMSFIPVNSTAVKINQYAFGQNGAIAIRSGLDSTWEEWEVKSVGGTAYTLPTATDISLGGVRTGENIHNESGLISVPNASSTMSGVAMVIDNLESSLTAHALSAKQGYNLKKMIQDHASSIHLTENDYNGVMELLSAWSSGLLSTGEDFSGGSVNFLLESLSTSMTPAMYCGKGVGVYIDNSSATTIGLPTTMGASLTTITFVLNTSTASTVTQLIYTLSGKVYMRTGRRDTWDSHIEIGLDASHAKAIASDTTLGHVKVGEGLAIDSSGVLSAIGGKPQWKDFVLSDTQAFEGVAQYRLLENNEIIEIKLNGVLYSNMDNDVFSLQEEDAGLTMEYFTISGCREDGSILEENLVVRVSNDGLFSIHASYNVGDVSLRLIQQVPIG